MRAKKRRSRPLLMGMAGKACFALYLGHGQEKACLENLELGGKWIVSRKIGHGWFLACLGHGWFLACFIQFYRIIMLLFYVLSRISTYNHIVV